MSKKDLDAKEIEEKVHNLAKSMEKVRSAQADKDDVVVDMRHATRSRLEMLAEDLLSVFNEVPPGNDQFEFALTQGETPRLWIDMTAFVRMSGGGQEYEFVKDTRLGRVVLARGKDREEIGQHVTDYVAERIVLREREIEGDWISFQTAADTNAKNGNIVGGSTGSVSTRTNWISLVWFILGMVGGAIALTLLAWHGYLESMLSKLLG